MNFDKIPPTAVGGWFIPYLILPASFRHLHLLVRIMPKMSIEESDFFGKWCPQRLIEGRMNQLLQSSEAATCGELSTALFENLSAE